MAVSSTLGARLRSVVRLAGAQVAAASLSTGEVIRALKVRTPESRLTQLSRVLATSPLGAKLQRYGGEAWLVVARWPILRSVFSAAGLTQPAPSGQPSPGGDVAARDPLDARRAVEVLRDAPEWSRRAKAARALAGVAEPSAQQALRDALRDASAEVAVAAVDALAQVPGDGVLPAFREILANPHGFYSPVVRAAVIGPLAASPDRGNQAVVETAVRDVDAEVSLSAIAAIAERAPERAAEQLLPILNDPSSFFLPVVRLAAVTALERSHAVAPALAEELLRNEQDDSVRRALERMANPAASAN